MAFRDDLAANSSAAALAICQALGVLVGYINKASATVNIYVWPDDEYRDGNPELGSGIEEDWRDFNAPTQANFPPALGINIGDRIVWNGITYVMRSFTADTLGAVYVLKCVKARASKAGR